MKRALCLLVVLTACKAADDYVKKGKMSEAKLMLNKLSKAAKAQAIERGMFPVGKVGPTPSEDCCKHPGGKCPVDPKQWQTPPWTDLDFQIDDPHLFRYSYESDGKTFTATAVGDLDCDTSMVTYTATGKLVDGAPETVIDDKPSGTE